MTSIDVEEMQNLSAMIVGLVDFDKCRAEENRVIIRENVNEQLDSARAIYEQLPDRLSHTAGIVADQLELRNANVNQVNVVYFPQLGFLTIVPIAKQFDVERSMLDWEFMIK